MSDSADELNAFCKYWESLGLFDWSGKNIAIVRCLAQYKIRNKEREDEVEAHLYHDGKIELIGNGWLNSEDHYTGLVSEYQEYRYLKRAHALKIIGKGPKLGAYSLKLVPTRP